MVMPRGHLIFSCPLLSTCLLPLFLCLISILLLYRSAKTAVSSVSRVLLNYISALLVPSIQYKLMLYTTDSCKATT